MKPKAIKIHCNGEAHNPIVAGCIDNCGVCMPFWEWYPICPKHKRKLKTSGYCKECGGYYEYGRKWY